MLVLLLGCGGWIDQDPGCELAVYDWSDDLLAHILTGDGSGAFDYDPVDTPRKRLKGAYNPSSGNFDYEVSFKDDYFLSSELVEGYGTVFHNGDLDLVYSSVVTDKLGVVSETSYRVERKACSMVANLWEGHYDLLESGELGATFAQTGTYDSNSKYTWTAADSAYSYTGTLKDNLTRQTDVLAFNGSYSSSTVEKPAGTSTRSWSGVCYTSYGCVGSDSQAFNGDVTSVYQVLDGETLLVDFSWLYPYEGGGTGTGIYYENNRTVTCSFVIEIDDSCSYSCDDGSSGRC